MYVVWISRSNPDIGHGTQGMFMLYKYFDYS